MSGFARAATRNTRSNDRLWENPFWTNRKKYRSTPIGFTFYSQFVFTCLQKNQFYFTIFTFPCSAFHGIDTVTRHAFTWLPRAHCTNFGRVFLRLRFLHKLSILEPFSVKKPYFFTNSYQNLLFFPFSTCISAENVLYCFHPLKPLQREAAHTERKVLHHEQTTVSPCLHHV